MDRGPLVCVQRCVRPGVLERDLPQSVVGGVEGEVVARGLKHRLRLLDEHRQARRGALWLEGHSNDARLDPPANLAHLVTGTRCPLGDGIRAPKSGVAIARPK